MNYYFITGTSSGIGKALVENLVKTEGNKIVGYSRRKSIEHPQYCHQEMDLSDIQKVKMYSFPEIKEADKIVLINNAGTLGEIKHFGSVCNDKLIETMNVNTTSLAMLSNVFIHRYQNIACQKIIINISSGAASSPYDGWAAYCASKASVDMLTQVIVKEQSMQKNPINCFAIAPGVVDTYMQTMIRETDEQNFSRIEKFHELKETGALYGADAVAKELLACIDDTSKIPSIVSRISL